MGKKEEILALVAQKFTSKQIAQQLGVPLGTVNYHRHGKKDYHVLRISEHRRKIKKKAISYSGGRCLKCGYDKCEAALEFHHLNPSEKEFRLAAGRTWGWEKSKLEVDKTILVCSNCHRELHDGVWTPDHRMIETQVAVRVAYQDKPLVDYKDEVYAGVM